MSGKSVKYPVSGWLAAPHGSDLRGIPAGEIARLSDEYFDWRNAQAVAAGEYCASAGFWNARAEAKFAKGMGISDDPWHGPRWLIESLVTEELGAYWSNVAPRLTKAEYVVMMWRESGAGAYAEHVAREDARAEARRDAEGVIAALRDSGLFTETMLERFLAGLRDGITGRKGRVVVAAGDFAAAAKAACGTVKDGSKRAEAIAAAEAEHWLKPWLSASMHVVREGWAVAPIDAQFEIVDGEAVEVPF